MDGVASADTVVVLGVADMALRGVSDADSLGIRHKFVPQTGFQAHNAR
jgi:hypothetical protein